MNNFLKIFFKQRILGVDIGTDSIKVAEISVWGKHKKLENYSEVKSSLVSKDPLLSVDEKGNLVSSSLISSALREILKEASIKTKKVVFSLPDFLTLAASFEIPPMPEKEIAGAVYYNASRYITLPISEVTLDWRIVPNNPQSKDSPMKVFLIAIPNQVIKEYQEIAKAAGLNLHALEPEVFGIVRSLAKNDKNVACLIDMGAKTSTINIIDNGHLKRSYSFNFSGNQLSTALSSALGVKLEEVEKVKNEEGILSKKENVTKTLKSFIDQLFSEIKNISTDFLEEEKKQIDEFYLTGGISNLPGLKDYFMENFKGPVYIPNYFSDFDHPRILKDSLFQMSPRFSVVVGVALVILDI